MTIVPLFLLILTLTLPANVGAETHPGFSDSDATSTTISPPSISGPVRVELHDGRSHEGRPISFRDDILVLRTRLDGGTVDRGFPRDQIAHVHFPGDEIVAGITAWLELKDYAQALPHLEAVWSQRAPFLVLLDSDTINLLTFLPTAHLAAGDPYRAIGLARNLLPHATTLPPPGQNRLHESILIGHYHLEFHDEAETLARQWIQRQETLPSSALGWKILAHLALHEENFEQVAWLALQPVAMAGPQRMPYLSDCYALAIHAFDQLDEIDRATRLYGEMLERALPWPPNEVLAETEDIYRSKITEAAKKLSSTPEPDLDLRPPEDDLNLPIQEVRKLLRSTEP